MGSEDALHEILSGQSTRFDLPWVNRPAVDGNTRYVNLVHLPTHDDEGNITGLIHLVQDVTELGSIQQHLSQQRNELWQFRDELKRQNVRLAAANAELQSLDGVKSTFISIAAHELRGPLTAIVGYLELLFDDRKTPLSDRDRDYLEIVWGGAQRLLSLTNDLLDITRMEAGRLELRLQPVDLGALINSVASEYAAQITTKGQQLTLDLAADMPTALCDPKRTAQVIGNLLTNAIKFTPADGHIWITLAPAPEDGFLLLSVQDDGVGIPASEQAEVFNRFFQASSTRSMGGTGLGLHIARSLVEQHGGRMWLESELGRGSTFFATFPVRM